MKRSTKYAVGGITGLLLLGGGYYLYTRRRRANDQVQVQVTDKGMENDDHIYEVAVPAIVSQEPPKDLTEEEAKDVAIAAVKQIHPQDSIDATLTGKQDNKYIFEVAVHVPRFSPV